ncbi:LytR/AlgR family response regulator transcription factor [Flavihumibacter solisilvae]|uniref:LytR family transcriptional regulator n=1 Tax=Flavihumibacter solisilvae TaxID=1349421 RepID=A0A0C1IM16_9BACT|nr:LytTR family transcriptional regulator DNA-binding domain-containing protein [Flavihumibacter solisilvae]KIC95295.1 LytR family transcriptional regulator [Flavihumibacter solisilvae]
MFRVIIIDDEPLASQVIREYLQAHPQFEVTQACNDGFEGLKAIQQHHPDLVFLDIQMPKINGFEMLELVEDPPAIIFATAFDEYAIRAFEHHAVDYLLKPFSQERFDKAIHKFAQQHSADNAGRGEKTKALLETAAQSPMQNDRIVIRDNNNIRIVLVDDIHYIEAADDYARIATSNGIYLKNRTMQSFEQLLPASGFIRIHRSYIVNIKEITQLHQLEKETYLVLLRSGKKLPVSRSGYSKLRVALK